MASEQHIQQEIRLALSRGNTRLWRNNVGALRDQSGRMVTFGLGPGSSDLVGFTRVRVTPEMVGQTVAVFTAIEVKAEKGQARPDQQAWLDHVQAAGGRAGIARSVADAQAIITGEHQRSAVTMPRCSTPLSQA